jgi:hypothetical protein
MFLSMPGIARVLLVIYALATLGLCLALRPRMLRMLAIGLVLCGSGLASARPHRHKATRKHRVAHVATARASKPLPSERASPRTPETARAPMVEQATDDEVPDRTFRR